MELRAVVPRRPARPVGARHLRRRCTACRRRVRPRRARRAGRGGDRRRRPARQPFAAHRRRRRLVEPGPLPAARQHPRVRARGDEPTPGSPSAPSPRTPAGSPTPPDPRQRACAAAGRPSTSPSPGPSGPTSTPHWRGASRTTRCSRSTSSTGSGGPGSCSATAGAHSGSWPRSTRAGDARAPTGTGPTRCCSRRGSRRRPVTSTSLATTSPLPTDLADEIDDVDLQARCCYYLAYVVSHDGEFRHALELTDRSSALYDGSGPAVGSGRELALRRPSGDLRRRPRSAASTRSTRSSTGCERVDDPWLHVRCDAHARRAGPHPAPVRRCRRCTSVGAAETSRRLGFRQTEAYQLASLGRAQCQAGDYAAGAATLRARRSTRPRPPVTCAWPRSPGSTSDASCGRSDSGRGPSRARVGGGMAPRRRRRRAGRARRVPARRAGRRRRCRRVPRNGSPLSSTRRDGTVTATSRCSPSMRWPASPLDAGDIARATQLCEAADRRMASVSHFITEQDRTDAHAVRQRA